MTEPQTTKTAELQYQITKDWIDRLVEQKTPNLTMRLDDLVQIKAALDSCSIIFNCGECGAHD